jgi:hypothetical protein
MENATTKHLIDLANAYGGHLGLSHWRVSFLVRGNGQFFKGLEDGKSCTLKTAAAVLGWFSENWPADLSWPDHIQRPAKTKREAA